jgi:hypothetical protein
MTTPPLSLESTETYRDPGPSASRAADPLGSGGSLAHERLAQVRARVFRHFAGEVGAEPEGRVIDLCVGELGLGVYARRAIAAGEEILQMTGPEVTFDEAVAKGDEQCYTLQIGPTQYVDLAEPGRYANHSCDPNAGVIGGARARAAAGNARALGLTLLAIRPIRRGEEVCFDYSTTMDEDHWTMPCRCGSPDCRGVVADFKELPKALRQRYLALGIVQPFIANQPANLRLLVAKAAGGARASGARAR